MSGLSWSADSFLIPTASPASEADERCPSDGVEPIGEVVEIGVEQMPIYRERERRRRVTEDRLNGFRAGAGGDHRGGRRVSKNVDPDRGKARPLQRREPTP